MFRWVKSRMKSDDEDSPQAWEWTGPIHDRDPVLHQAAYLGDLNKIKQVLSGDSVKNTHSCDDEGSGDADTDNELGSINAKNRLGCTPLRLAATGTTTSAHRHLEQSQ